MHETLKNNIPVLQQTVGLRDELLGWLTDEDLQYKLPGENVTLGELCKQMGEVQHSYIEAFKTMKQNFDYVDPHTEWATSVAALKAWYAELDAALMAALEAIDDIEQNMIDRGEYQFPIMVAFHVYREALLIFYAKADVYLRAMGKHEAVSQKWLQWIG